MADDPLLSDLACEFPFAVLLVLGDRAPEPFENDLVGECGCRELSFSRRIVSSAPPRIRFDQRREGLPPSDELSFLSRSDALSEELRLRLFDLECCGA